MSPPDPPRSYDPGTPGRRPDQRPFVAPCRVLAWSAPLRWLRLGWADWRAVPRISLVYGAFVAAVCLLMSWVGWRVGGWVMLFALLTGYVFVAPLLAFALYSVSRQLHQGLRPSLRTTLRAVARPFQNALVFALVLLIVFLIWARAGSMVHVFFPVDAHPGRSELLTFLAIGSAVGSVFAAFSFAASAFSLPMLANRDVDVVTAVVSSINAVLRNKPAMALWAALIVALTALGIATALLGLVVVIPWLAYATWHGYREALDVSDWAVLPVGEEK